MRSFAALRQTVRPPRTSQTGGGGQEVANRYVELPSRKPVHNRLANCRMRELGNRIGRESRQPVQVAQYPSEPIGIGSGSVDDMRLRKLLGKSRLLVRIAPAAVVRNQRELMAFGESSQDVEGANFATSVDREEPACLDPRHSLEISSPRGFGRHNRSCATRSLVPARIFGRSSGPPRTLLFRLGFPKIFRPRRQGGPAPATRTFSPHTEAVTSTQKPGEF